MGERETLERQDEVKIMSICCHWINVKPERVKKKSLICYIISIKQAYVPVLSLGPLEPRISSTFRDSPFCLCLPSSIDTFVEHHRIAENLHVVASPVMSNNAEEWTVPVSTQSLNTVNPIRDLVDQLNIPTNTEKPLIPLSIGA